MARTIYREADIYLLDDPLSAVDAHVAKHIFRYGIKDFLAGKTVLLVTHNIQFARICDCVYSMANGTIVMDSPVHDITMVQNFTEILTNGKDGWFVFTKCFDKVLFKNYKLTG